MNISGQGVKKAWREYSSKIINEGLEPRLVIIHDELESPLGKVSVKEGTASPRGHNGLKSCQATLGNMKWWRIGVGIGRPESREPDVVSRYVLRKMNGAEQKAMQKASASVVDSLRQISEGVK
jgi:PTH1 family peptidyl-tRNA hydrolase